MTYTLTLTPYLAAQLAACCLHAGLDVRNIFPAHLTRHTTTATPAAEATAPATPPHPTPAGDSTPAAAKLRALNLPPVSLTAPGDILPAPDDIDWDDPALYK